MSNPLLRHWCARANRTARSRTNSNAPGLAKYCEQNSGENCVACCAVASLRQTRRGRLTAHAKHGSARREAEGERLQLGGRLPPSRHRRHLLQLRDAEAGGRAGVVGPHEGADTRRDLGAKARTIEDAVVPDPRTLEVTFFRRGDAAA